MDLIREYAGDKSKIDACKIDKANIEKDYIENLLPEFETILSTRLKDETFRGMSNFMRTATHKPSIDESEKALVSDIHTDRVYAR